MKKYIFSLLIMPAALLWVSCGDDTNNDPDPTPQKTQKDLLMAGDWLAVKGTVDPPITIEIFGQTITITDFFELEDMEPCESDNLLRFKADGTVEDDEGATKCNASDPQTSYGGKWTMSADFKTLTVIDDSDPAEPDTLIMKNIVVTSTKLTGVSEIVIPNPLTQTETTHKINFEFTNKK